MKSNRIIYVNIIVCILLTACGVPVPFAKPTPTPTPTLTPTLTSTTIPTATLTLTPLPPTETQTPARPAAPANLEITYTCSRGRWRSYNVTIKLSWEDKSDNETGFEIFKNKVLIKTMEANATEAIDFDLLYNFDSGSASYEMRTFNDAGKSGRIIKDIYYRCKQ